MRKKFCTIIILLACLASLGAVGTNKQQLFETDENYCFRIPAVLSSGRRLIVVAERREGHPRKRLAKSKMNIIDRCSDFGNIDLVARISSDEGASWSEISVVVNHIELSDNGRYKTILAGNPTLIPGKLEGDLILLFAVARTDGTNNSGRCLTAKQRDSTSVCDGTTVDQGIWSIASRDFGRTWTKPRQLDVKVPAVAQRPGPGHGVRLASGALVSPAYGGLLRSNDNGLTWVVGAQLARGELEISESALSYLDDGSLWLTIRPTASTYRRLRKIGYAEIGMRLSAISLDGGRTFKATVVDWRFPSPPVQVSTINVPGKGFAVAFPRSKKVPTGAVKGADRRDLFLAEVSTAGAQDKVKYRLVSTGSAGYSDMTLMPSGNVGIAFEASTDAAHSDGATGYLEGIKFLSITLRANNECFPVENCSAESEISVSGAGLSEMKTLDPSR